MPDLDPGVWTAIVIALISLAGVIYTGRDQNRKAKSEAGTNLVTQAADVAAMETRLRLELQTRHDNYKKTTDAQLAELRAKIERLSAERTVRDLEIEALHKQVDEQAKLLEEQSKLIDRLFDWIRAQGVDPESI